MSSKVVTIPRFPTATVPMETTTKKLSIPKSLSSIIMNQQQMNTGDGVVAEKKIVKKSDFSMASILLNKTRTKDQKIEDEDYDNDDDVDEEKGKNLRKSMIGNQNRRHFLKQPLICRLENHNIPITTTSMNNIHQKQTIKSLLPFGKIFSHPSQHVKQHNQQQSLRPNNKYVCTNILIFNY